MFDRATTYFKDLITSEEITEDLLKQVENEDDDEKALKEVARRLSKRERRELRREKRKLKRRSGKTWTNHLGNQIVEPLQYFKPQSLERIDEILTLAASRGLKVRAAGSGHSYSDVATTSDFFLDTHAINRAADGDKPIVGQLRQEDLKPAWRATNLKSKWKSMTDTPEIDFDSPLEDILKVRSIAEGNTMIFETEAGITIKDLNKTLTKANLGMVNMGGYDGQTIIGAISTSTHGSGVGLGPFPDLVRSVLLATTGKWQGPVVSGSPSNDAVSYYRIEPSDGITDGESYKQNQQHYRHNGKDIQLVQDDDFFYSVIVSLGTMGVIYSLVLDVMELYYLTETRQLSTLDKTLEQFKPNQNNPGHIPDILHRYRNCEFLVHPYPMQGKKVVEMDLSRPRTNYYKDFLTLETKRNITHPPEKDDDRDDDDKKRNPVTKILGKLDLSFKALAALLNSAPKATPKIIRSALDGLQDQNYVKKSFRIYNLGIDGDAGFATEIAIPVYDEAGKFTTTYLEEAIWTIQEVAQKARIEGLQYQTSPYSIRFVNHSKAYLSMMNRGVTAMIELAMVSGTEGGIETLNRLQEALYSKKGIPHWGLEFDCLRGNPELLKSMYPNFDKWIKVYQQLNSKGTFNNKTTARMGFSRVSYK